MLRFGKFQIDEICGPECFGFWARMDYLIASAGRSGAFRMIFSICCGMASVTGIGTMYAFSESLEGGHVEVRTTDDGLGTLNIEEMNGPRAKPSQWPID